VKRGGRRVRNGKKMVELRVGKERGGEKRVKMVDKGGEE